MRGSRAVVGSKLPGGLVWFFWGPRRTSVLRKAIKEVFSDLCGGSIQPLSATRIRFKKLCRRFCVILMLCSVRSWLCLCLQVPQPYRLGKIDGVHAHDTCWARAETATNESQMQGMSAFSSIACRGPTASSQHWSHALHEAPGYMYCFKSIG